MNDLGWLCIEYHWLWSHNFYQTLMTSCWQLQDWWWPISSIWNVWIDCVHLSYSYLSSFSQIWSEPLMLINKRGEWASSWSLINAQVVVTYLIRAIVAVKVCFLLLCASYLRPILKSFILCLLLFVSLILSKATTLQYLTLYDLPI